MNTYYETRIKYDDVTDKGEYRAVLRTHIVSAINHAEAENRIIAEMQPNTFGNLTVELVKKVKFEEIFLDKDCDEFKFYRVKALFVSFHEETNKEQRIVQTYLVAGNNFEQAYGYFKSIFKNTISDYEIVSIAETKILSVLE